MVCAALPLLSATVFGTSRTVFGTKRERPTVDGRLAALKHGDSSAYAARYARAAASCSGVHRRSLITDGVLANSPVITIQSHGPYDANYKMLHQIVHIYVTAARHALDRYTTSLGDFVLSADSTGSVSAYRARFPSAPVACIGSQPS